jgi:hypothetical protein
MVQFVGIDKGITNKFGHVTSITRMDIVDNRTHELKNIWYI